MRRTIVRSVACFCLALVASISPGAFDTVAARPQIRPGFSADAYVQQKFWTGADIVARYPIEIGTKTSKPDWIVPGAELGQPIAIDTSGRVYMILCPLDPSCRRPVVKVFSPTEKRPSRTFTLAPAAPGTCYVVTSLLADPAGRVYVGLNHLPSASASLEIFAANASGEARPIETIDMEGPATAMAFGPTGDLVVNVRGQAVETYATPLKHPTRTSTIVLPAEAVSHANGGLAVASNGDLYVGVPTGAILEYSSGSKGLVPPNRLWFPGYDGNAIGFMNGVVFFATRDGEEIGGTVGAFIGAEMNDFLGDVLPWQNGILWNVLVRPRQ
jgi:hypothetical protein